MKRLLLICAVIIAPANVIQAQYATTTKRDLVYATTTNGRQLHLDLILPKNAPLPLKVIVWAHPGNWYSGTHHGGNAVREAARGYVVASGEYRLSGEAIFPAQLADLKALVRWLRVHAVEYKLNPNVVIAWGSSAGAHLASLLGTTGDDDTLNGDVETNLYDSTGTPISSRVSAVIDWFGPVDFLSEASQVSTYCKTYAFYDHNSPTSGESQLIGAGVQTVPAASARANPAIYITPGDAKFFIMHGLKDCRVPPVQSQIFHDALTVAGVNSQIVFVRNAAHGGSVFALVPSSVSAMVDAFLDAQ